MNFQRRDVIKKSKYGLTLALIILIISVMANIVHFFEYLPIWFFILSIPAIFGVLFIIIFIGIYDIDIKIKKWWEERKRKKWYSKKAKRYYLVLPKLFNQYEKLIDRDKGYSIDRFCDDLNESILINPLSNGKVKSSEILNWHYGNFNNLEVRVNKLGKNVKFDIDDILDCHRRFNLLLREFTEWLNKIESITNNKILNKKIKENYRRLIRSYNKIASPNYNDIIDEINQLPNEGLQNINSRTIEDFSFKPNNEHIECTIFFNNLKISYLKFYDMIFNKESEINLYNIFNNVQQIYSPEIKKEVEHLTDKLELLERLFQKMVIINLKNIDLNKKLSPKDCVDIFFECQGLDPILNKRIGELTCLVNKLNQLKDENFSKIEERNINKLIWEELNSLKENWNESLKDLKKSVYKFNKEFNYNIGVHIKNINF